VTIKLQPGENKILLKCTNGTTTWQVYYKLSPKAPPDQPGTPANELVGPALEKLDPARGCLANSDVARASRPSPAGAQTGETPVLQPPRFSLAKEQRDNIAAFIAN